MDLGYLQEVLVWFLYIHLISQEQDLEQMLVNRKHKDNSTDYLIAVKKFLQKTESKGYIKDLVFLFLVFPLTELSISGNK